MGEGVLVLILALAYAVPRDITRLKGLKYGRRLKGPVMCEPRAFNKVVKGDGIGIETADGKTVLRIPRANEAQHLEIIGDTGSGKTTALEAIREGAERRGYAVEGFAPTSKASSQLRDAGLRNDVAGFLKARRWAHDRRSRQPASLHA